ncbi:MAG: Pr6Pr family membrane protein [Oscillospiraceae bacterium]|nr:Pr6Pr family membrane protein [Oscillospiraceae bacterium]
MKTNRTAQLIYQSFYCALGLVGIFASFGIFDDITMIRWDFYVHFTNLSNYFCIGIMLAQLIQTAKKKEDSYITVAPLLKFIGVLAILLTFVVFNALLAGAEGRDPQLNWRVGSLLAHVLLPIMYVGDWFLFREHGKTKWYYPIASVGFPLAYMMFIFIQAAILKFDTSILIPGTTTPLIYPYFFVNLETQGVGGVAKWAVLMFLAFMAVGFLFFGIDKLLKRKNTCN